MTESWRKARPRKRKSHRARPHAEPGVHDHCNDNVALYVVGREPSCGEVDYIGE